MRWLLLMCLIGCGEESLIIVSPRERTIVPTTGDLTLKVEGEKLEGIGEIVVELGAVKPAITTTFKNPCDPCQFDVTFSAVPFPPRETSIRVSAVTDLVTMASDEVLVIFVAP